MYNLGAAIDRSAGRDDCALIDLGGDEPPRSYSFRQIDELSDGVARGLLARGLKSGDRVAIASANRTEYVIAYLGIMRAGLVVVPVNIKLPLSSLQFIVRNSDAKLILCDAERKDLCPSEIPVILMGAKTEDGFDALVSPGTFQSIQPEPGQAAMFMYTSGSTGEPKGVVLSHESHLWVLAMRRRPVSSDRQRILIAAPLYHMNALSTLHAAIAQHDSVVLLPTFSVPSYIDAIGRYRCTTLTSVPTMMAMMLRQRELLQTTDLSSVTTIRMGSAPASPGLFQSLHTLFPHATVTNVYGTTESSPITFTTNANGPPQPPLSSGSAHPEVKLRLVDGDNKDASQGVLEIKSPGLMLRYHKLPEETHKVMTPDGFYVTGDIFRRDFNGFYFFVGRVDDMFVCGGENIYPREIEKMLERHPAVQQSCVVPIPDEIKNQKPVAFAVLKPGMDVTEHDLKAYALANAPAYQHPRFIWFIKELPLTGTNKIDRKELTKLALALLFPGQARKMAEGKTR
jgi:long-chain acyl-CoA synthetase